MFKYLYIDEDMDITGNDNDPDDDDLTACDDGYLNIIRVSDQTYYFDGKWQSILAK